jgi:hypothetical protein
MSPITDNTPEGEEHNGWDEIIKTINERMQEDSTPDTNTREEQVEVNSMWKGDRTLKRRWSQTPS